MNLRGASVERITIRLRAATKHGKSVTQERGYAIRPAVSEFRIVRKLLHVLLEPGWAPFSVIALHLVFAEYGLTERFDHLLHFLGGAAITYFLYQVMKLGSFLPDGYRWMNYVCAFTTGCTVAVFWEFAEFASDVFRQTSVQQSLQETMLDLVFGVLGAIAALLVVSAVCLVRGNRKVL